MYQHILVPVAFDDAHDPKEAIAVARRLVAEDGQVTLLHVMANVPNYVINYVPKGFQEEAQAAIVASLEAMGAEMPNARGVVTEGSAGKTIVNWAKNEDVDCIVIASHRPGVQDIVLGSTAAQVVRHATCAIHVTR
ncbi:universal stress protein [Shimia sp. R9_1]|uniref:universal stress protein n=1 Tax=unclassified Shimia TaxID=2630038 RepID=UPI001AD9CF6C|nr:MULTISPECIES: universal stress protein [unclassified Shimia]MBO9396611.1 universal stress protein [Shimia sp. R9_2]MBO9400216.1 universal stress protein [Shimia sp. R9_3]MBO9406472.1 universal stress protein [Shimia sp. R9_1]